MVHIDVDGVSELAEELRMISEDAEELLFRIQQINGEMSYDTELLMFPQGQTLLQELADTINDGWAAEDILHDLSRLLSDLPEEYRILEKFGKTQWQLAMYSMEAER